jgi:nanoRNase/pAp phosphatase (c-di-AMP/oligoRNAs hydrolase)
MSTLLVAGQSLSAQFLRTLAPYERIDVVMHDNPDPDAIAAGWALMVLIQERLGKPVKLVGGGAIVRAENLHMVELLTPPIELIDELHADDTVAVVLVDCNLGNSNHLVSRQKVLPMAIIDHHRNEHRWDWIPFVDIRPSVAASATIAADYLRQQNVEPGDKLATALLYAIRTETSAYETHYTELDRGIVLWLTERADPALASEIENAPLTKDYFTDLALALQSVVVYGDTAVCLLPRAEGSEIVGELADMLIRCRDIRRVLSGAVIGDDLLISVRTQRRDDCASQLVRQLLDGLGSGGGHGHRAGGKIANVAPNGFIPDSLRANLVSRWLKACSLPQSQGTNLISRCEIIEHL